MATSVEDFTGRYTLDRNNSGDLGEAHLSLCGVNFFKRKMLVALSITVDLEVKGDKYIEKTLTTFVNKTLEFTLGGEATTYHDDGIGFELVRAIRYENGKLLADIKEKDGKFTITEERYLSADKKVMHHDTFLHYGGKDAKSLRQFIRC